MRLCADALQRQNNMHKGYGFVEFADEESANAAYRLLNGVDVNDRMLKLDKCTIDVVKGMGDIGEKVFVWTRRLRTALDRAA